MKKLIPSLNGLRALSIMMVISYHFLFFGYFNFSNNFLKSMSHFFFNGRLGVNIFLSLVVFLLQLYS